VLQRHDVTPGLLRAALRWCFVDPLQCERPHSEVTAFPQASIGAERLALSYATCGKLLASTDSHQHIVEQMRKMAPLRVSFPSDSRSGYTLVTVSPNETGVGGTRRDGSMVSFVDELLASAGVTWREVPISAASYAAYPMSSFTACVHEVGLNNTDLCAANTWDTEQRRRLSQLTRRVYEDEFRLVVPKRTPDLTGVTNAIRQAFAPFSTATWPGLVGTILYTAIAIWIVEGWTNEADFPKKGLKSGLQTGCFKVLQSFFGANDHRLSPHTLCGRLMILGLSFCILVMTSNYTAKVTVQDIRLVQETEVRSLEEAISNQYRICALSVITDSLRHRCTSARTQTAVFALASD
jgi:hypothetical protein